MNEVFVSASNKNLRKLDRSIKSVVLRVLELLNQKDSVMEVNLVNSRTMKFLNKKFRGRCKAADVLSFRARSDFPHPEFERGLARPSAKKRGLRSGPKRRAKYLGEIYLNEKIYLKSPRRLILGGRNSIPLLIHGILHLLNYTHERKDDRIKMEKKEQKILSKIRI